jgi:hypothetical protein
LASGDKDEETLGGAGGNKVIAQLLAIKFDLLGCGIDVCLPIDYEVDRATRLISDRIGNAADIGCNLVVGLCVKNRCFGQ